MGFSNNTFAKVWNVNKKEGGAISARISTSRKTKDGYTNDFNGWCLMLGQAAEKAAALKEGDSIKLLSVDVSNTYNKEQAQAFTTFKVFDYDPVAPKTE